MVASGSKSTRAAIDLLKRLSKPFLNWAGKAERHQISVPTVPLFVHERHSTKAILEGIRNRKAKGTTLDLFGDAQMDIGERLDAYEHQGPWQNRMILGDSLQIMNSMLEFERSWRSGSDDLHRSALWGEVWIELPAVCWEAEGR